MRIPIGTKYISSGKHPRLCEVIDYEITFNKDNELIRFRYTSKHELMNQDIITHDVLYSSVVRSIVPGQYIPILAREFDKLIRDDLEPMSLKECETFINNSFEKHNYLIHELGKSLPDNAKSKIDYNWGIE